MPVKKKPDISVIIPTYNESLNLPILIPRIAAALKSIHHEIIIADDNSPDGTYQEARQLARRFPQVRAICRTHDRGLSPAVIDGFAVANGDLFVVMDADLQHDEKILPFFLNRFQHGAEIIIGSRKTEGGGIEGWSWSRRFISAVASLIARVMVKGLPGDPMSGYFGISAKLFRQIADQVNPRGFKILLEILAHSGKVEISEIGYIFRPRTHGESKLSSRTIFSYLIALYDLRFGKLVPLRYLQFSLVGFLGLLLNQALLFLLKRQFNLPNEIALIPAIELALIFNFFVNNEFTFAKEKLRKIPELARGFLIFHVICLLGAYINYAVALHLSGFLHLNIYMANAIGIFLASFWNYFINAQMIWKK